MAPGYPGGGRPAEELRRVSRILEIAQMIAVRPSRYHRRDLADRFEISERMVQKDIAVIRHGLKLDLRAGPEGYFFARRPRLPALRYDFSQALFLMLAAQAACRNPGIDPDALAGALARIEVLFPPEFLPQESRHMGGRRTLARQPTDRTPCRRRHLLHRGGRPVAGSGQLDTLPRKACEGGGAGGVEKAGQVGAGGGVGKIRSPPLIERRSV